MSEWRYDEIVVREHWLVRPPDGPEVDDAQRFECGQFLMGVLLITADQPYCLADALGFSSLIMPKRVYVRSVNASAS